MLVKENHGAKEYRLYGTNTELIVDETSQEAKLIILKSRNLTRMNYLLQTEDEVRGTKNID